MSGKPQKKSPVRNYAPQQVRIIGGAWKRTPLLVTDAEGLRPTPDRVRETVFNWLTHLLDGQWEGVRCLDLFAGTGAMGFEAASRGAAKVTMVEIQPAALRRLQAMKEKLNAGQIDIVRSDAAQILRNLAASKEEGFDLIFLDPPYHQDWLKKCLPLCEILLKNGGMVYAESEFALEGVAGADWLAPWEIVRADRAGMVFYHVLQRKQFQA